LVYYLENTTLTAPQRLPLYDLSFAHLPLLSGPLWLFSDFLVYTLITITVVMLLSNFFVKWSFCDKPSSYALLRFFKTLVILQFLRSASFLVTFLPGASEQCLYTITDEMKDETVGEWVEGVADERGNSVNWNPPETWGGILFRSDSSKGCGDLIFSSHIMFALLSLITIIKYFRSKFLTILMSILVLIMIPFTLASRKHYSIDVLTSCYIVPIMYEILWMKFPDVCTRCHMKKRYGLEFQRNPNSENSEDSFILIVGDKIYGVSIDQLPNDFREEVRPKKLNSVYDSDLEMCMFRKWSGEDNGEDSDIFRSASENFDDHYDPNASMSSVRSRASSFTTSPERIVERS